jgi:hypothetical protein
MRLRNGADIAIDAVMVELHPSPDGLLAEFIYFGGEALKAFRRNGSFRHKYLTLPRNENFFRALLRKPARILAEPA